MADDFTAARMKLDKVLVRQFKHLKELIELTKRERAALLNDPDAMLAIIEDKEVLLDSMTLLEDQCREIVQEISLLLELRSVETSIHALLPFLEPEDARRIQTLSEGIFSLASQARELNRANQALAVTKLDWLKATQSFLLDMFLPEAGYQKPGSTSPRQDSAGLGVEFRA
jgi:hypothetical protein